MPESFIVGSTVALVAAVIGWFMNRNSAKKAVDLAFGKASDLLIRQEFVKSGAKFRESFMEALNRIHNSSLDTLDITFLKDQIPTQEMAFKTFIVHIPTSKRESLRDAWNEYKRKDDNEFRNEYTAVEGSDETIINEKRGLLLDRIDKIHKYTDPQFVFGDNANV